MRAVLLLITLLALVAGSGTGSALSGAASVECEQPGSWAVSQSAAWLRRAVEVAGYKITGCSKNAWIAAAPATSFQIWATPWQRPSGMQPAAEPYLRGAFSDGSRVVWQAQGLAIWVSAGPNPSDRLPGASVFGWLRLATRALPRRYLPLTMMPTPPAALRACRHDPALAQACPTRIPHLNLRQGSAGWRTYPSRPSRIDGIFGMQLGGEIPGRPELMRPPRNLHIEVEVTRSRPLGTPHPWPRGTPTPPRDGLIQQQRSAPLLVAEVRWGNKQGTVAFSPPYPSGGSQANHLIFRWRAHGRTYLLGMHAWEPFTEAFTTLRRIIETLPRS